MYIKAVNKTGILIQPLIYFVARKQTKQLDYRKYQRYIDHPCWNLRNYVGLSDYVLLLAPIFTWEG